MDDSSAGVGIEPASERDGRRWEAQLVGVLAFILAFFALAGVTGLERRLFETAAQPGGMGLVAYNVAFGFVPTMLTLALLLGLWSLCRHAAGSMLVSAAVVIWLGENVLAGRLSRLSAGPLSAALGWTATLLGVAWLAVLGLGLLRSRIVAPLVGWLAIVTAGAQALVIIAHSIVNALASAAIIVSLMPWVNSFSRYVLPLLWMAFLLALAFGMLVPGARVSNKRIEQNAKRLD